MSRRRVLIDLFEIRFYILFILLMTTVFLVEDSRREWLVTIVYYFTIIFRAGDLLVKSSFSKTVKRQKQVASISLLSYFAFFSAAVYFNVIFLIAGLIITFIVPLKFFIFNRNVTFERYLVPLYTFCKRYYVDLILVYLLHLFFRYTGLVNLSSECSMFFHSIIYATVFTSFAVLWHLITSLITRKQIQRISQQQLTRIKWSALLLFTSLYLFCLYIAIYAFFLREIMALLEFAEDIICFP